jgi:hypothetical protein
MTVLSLSRISLFSGFGNAAVATASTRSLAVLPPPHAVVVCGP